MSPQLARHALRFGAVGVLNTGVYLLSYLALRVTLPYLVAHIAAIVISMVVAFFAHCYWTFQARPTWGRFAAFPLTNAVNYSITTAGVVVSREWLDADERVAPLIAVGIAVPITFLLTRRIFVNPRRREPVAGTTC